SAVTCMAIGILPQDRKSCEKFVSLDGNTSQKKRLDIARILISTTHPGIISQSIFMRVNEQLFSIRVSEEILGKTLFVPGAKDFGKRKHIVVRNQDSVESIEKSEDASISMVPYTLDELISAALAIDATEKNGEGDKTTKTFSKPANSNHDPCLILQEEKRYERKRSQEERIFLQKAVKEKLKKSISVTEPHVAPGNGVQSGNRQLDQMDPLQQKKKKNCMKNKLPFSMKGLWDRPPTAGLPCIGEGKNCHRPSSEEMLHKWDKAQRNPGALSMGSSQISLRSHQKGVSPLPKGMSLLTRNKGNVSNLLRLSRAQHIEKRGKKSRGKVLAVHQGPRKEEGSVEGASIRDSSIVEVLARVKRD
ncbi:hypothetical protein Ancab_019773, partial [Ancistrocladus abbreviatus]